MTVITRFDSPLTHDNADEFARQIKAVLENFGLELDRISYDYTAEEIKFTVSSPVKLF